MKSITIRLLANDRKLIKPYRKDYILPAFHMAMEAVRKINRGETLGKKHRSAVCELRDTITFFNDGMNYRQDYGSYTPTTTTSISISDEDYATLGTVCKSLRVRPSTFIREFAVTVAQKYCT